MNITWAVAWLKQVQEDLFNLTCSFLFLFRFDNERRMVMQGPESVCNPFDGDGAECVPTLVEWGSCVESGAGYK
jgi:hypothetical protein